VNERLKAAIEAAKALLAEAEKLNGEEAKTKLAEAQAKRAEAQSIADQMREAKALSSLETEYTPLRPDLPGTGAGATPAVATAPTQATDAAKSGVTDLALIDNTKQVAYVTRFGTEHEMVKGILTDLHGKDYQSIYWQQKAAFNRYVRWGNEGLKSGDAQMLKGIVMTPQAVKIYLDLGVDDIAIIKAMMVEASDTLGGYLVPVDFQMKIIQQLAALTLIRGRASQMNTSRDRVEMPEATGGNGRYTSPVRVTWVDETPTVGQITANYVTFGLRGINVHTAMAEAPLSRNFLEDVAFDIEGYLADKLSEAIALDEDEQFIKGNGVGKPRGILPGLTNALSITEVPSLGASTLTWNGLIAMTYGIKAQYRQAGVWVGNRHTFQTIAQMQDSTSGNYLWQAYQFDGGEPGRSTTLLGYPIVENELMPDIGAGAYPLLFGDLGAYQIVDRLGMTVERFIGAQEARQNLVYFVMRRRLGGELVEDWKLVVQKVAAS